MGLKTELPEDFKPSEFIPLKDKRDLPDSQWWIGTKEGGTKKYGEATPEEVLWFAKRMFKDLRLEDGSKLTLRVAKGAVLDICLNIAMYRYRNLFGGPELWDNLEDWERTSKLAKKEKEEND